MKAVFIELLAFTRYRERYLDDDGYSALQDLLIGLYDKDEMADLTPGQRAILKERVKSELQARMMP